jgi:hypothetical protein
MSTSGFKVICKVRSCQKGHLVFFLCQGASVIAYLNQNIDMTKLKSGVGCDKEKCVPSEGCCLREDIQYGKNSQHAGGWKVFDFNNQFQTLYLESGFYKGQDKTIDSHFQNISKLQGGSLRVWMVSHIIPVLNLDVFP